MPATIRRERRRTIPQDEARVSNKGRLCHRWLKGERAPGLCQRGYQWAYLYTAVRPATGENFTVVLPTVDAGLMDLFLARFGRRSPTTSTPSWCLTAPAGTTPERLPPPIA